MSGFLRQPLRAAPLPAAIPAHNRAPQRITATISWQLRQQIQERADLEGRSLSNLVAFLLEQGMGMGPKPPGR